MRLFFTLIASGLLILTEIPAEQPPPIVPNYAQVYSGSPSVYQDVPRRVTHNESQEDNYQARQSPAVNDDGLESGPDLFLIDYKISSISPAATAITTSRMATYSRQSVLPITGYATYYNPNVMREVLSNRLMMGQVSLCNECVGTVALLWAGDINRRIWLQWADGSVEGPFLVIDAAASQHVKQLLARQWVVDVDNRTAARHGMLGPVMVTVWGSPPEPSQVAELPLLPLSYSLPFEERSEAQAQLPGQTPTPTRMPSSVGTPNAVMASAQRGFPTETPIPTITPLPAINNASSPTPAAVLSAAEASIPTKTPAPRSTPAATATPLPVSASPAPVKVIIGGFPAATASPTITPLPAIVPAATMSATTIIATPIAAMTVTLVPTYTPTPSLSPVASATRTVVLRGFPTETPVPTITPLPPINVLPTPNS